MKLTEWNIDKEAGEDTCELVLDDGRTIVTLVRARRGNKTTVATTFNKTILFEEKKLDDEGVLLKLLECLKTTYDNIRVKFEVPTPNLLGYTQSTFMSELRKFVMRVDPNCMVPEKYHPK